MTTKQRYPVDPPVYAVRLSAAERLASKPAASLLPGGATNMANGYCTLCGQDVTGFKNHFSLREWEILGLCQTCQDKTFTDPED